MNRWYKICALLVFGLSTACANNPAVVPISQAMDPAPIMQVTQATSLPTEAPTATSTDAPTATSLPAATQADVSAEQTQAAATAAAVLTATSTCTNQAELITSAIFPPDEKLSLNKPLTLIIELKNSGSCTWTPEYSLVLTSGPAINGITSLPLQASIPPGEKLSMRVNMIADEEGIFTQEWMLQDQSGSRFGVGSQPQVALIFPMNVVNYFADRNNFLRKNPCGT